MFKITPKGRLFIVISLFLFLFFPVILKSAYYSYPSSYHSTYCSDDTTKPFSHWELSSYQDAKKDSLFHGAYVLYYLEDQVDVTLGASDDVDTAFSECCVSGIDKIYYRIWRLYDSNGDGTPEWHLLFNWKPYNGESINFCQLGIDHGYGCDGKYELEYYAVDKAGNVESPNSQDFYVDSSADYTGTDRETCDQKDGCYRKYYPGTVSCSQGDYPGNCSYFDFEASGKQCVHQEIVTDNDGDGWDTQCDCDCNDSDPNINPGALEVCNDNIDNDCDGLIDCEDPDCVGEIGPDGGICCQVSSDCNGTSDSCECVNNECQACASGEICKEGSCVVNNAPNQPSNPSPEDRAEGVDFPPVNLSVDVSDPDSDSMDVSFYNDVNNSLIGTNQGIESGTRTSIDWDLVRSDCEYNDGFYNCKWHAQSCDTYGACTSSSTWTFQLCNFDGEVCSSNNQCCSGHCAGGYCSSCDLNRTGDYYLDYQCVLAPNTTHYLKNGNLNIGEGGSIVMLNNSILEFDSGHKILITGSDAYILKSEGNTKIKKIY